MPTFVSESLQRLVVSAAAGRPVELHPRNRNRRLQQAVEHEGPQRRRALEQILARVGVLELETDDHQAGADAKCRDASRSRASG